VTTALAENHRRKTKAEGLRARGVDPFPSFSIDGRTLVEDALACHNSRDMRAGAHPEFRYHFAGRLIGRCRRGSVTLLDLRDRSGTMRLCVRQGTAAGGEAIARILEWDIGDIVAVNGHIYVSNRGEVGLEVTSGSLLAKALRLPPTHDHGLKQAGNSRELELIASAECRKRVVKRSAVVAAVRDWFDRHDFIEVETPVLQSVAGGALARPFISHHNALGCETSLRISAELYLRRCTVGGLERVYDIGKRFRNEVMSRRHNPEFTMLEWFMAYSDYRDAAAFTEGLIAHVAQRALNGLCVAYRDTIIDLTTPWRRVTLQDVVTEMLGVDVCAASVEELVALLPEKPSTEVSWAEAVQRVFSTHVEPNLVQPTLVTHFPVEGRPFIKRDPLIPRIGESFEVVIGGMEIASGGTGVDDPDDQLERLAAQRGAQEDEVELAATDGEYVTALQYGAPPAAGSGIGIDRLLMILFDCDSIRDVIPFATPG